MNSPRWIRADIRKVLDFELEIRFIVENPRHLMLDLARFYYHFLPLLSIQEYLSPLRSVSSWWVTRTSHQKSFILRTSGYEKRLISVRLYTAWQMQMSFKAL